MAWWWSYNGFEFTEDNRAGVSEATGLDMPDIRSNDVVIPGQHGMFPGFDRLEARTIGLSVDVHPGEGQPFFTKINELSLATGPRDDEIPLRFQLGDDQPILRSNCRPRRRNTNLSQQSTYGFITTELQFVASDPLIYSDDVSSSSASAPTVPQGKAFSDPYSWDFGAPGVGGVVNVFNAGTAPTSWVAKIFGPCTNPSIIGPGGQLTWESELQAGEFLELNSHPSLQTVLVGGSSSQFGQLSDTSTWFLLPPGSSNVVLNTGDGNGSVLFSWRSAYWSAT